jgi:hypothetical protein
MWRHFSTEPIKAVRSTIQTNVWGKPSGLWISDESPNSVRSWTQYMCEEELGWYYRQHIYDVKFDASDLLLLPNKQAIYDFTTEFFNEEIAASYPHRLSGIFYDWIMWDKVSEKYSGILITPYIWSCRLNRACNWYYSWDCASGCIWNAEVITSIEEVSCDVQLIK